jgi:thermopsin
MSASRASVTFVLLIAVVVVLSGASSVRSDRPPPPSTGGSVLSPSHSPAGTAASAARDPVTTSAVERAHAIESALESRGAPLRDVHLPNLAAADQARTGTVGLTYSSAPAPMGVSDIGLRNSSGTIVPYSLNTTSAAGTIDLDSAQAVGVADDGPDMFGVQLNSVLTGVDLFGNSSYQFWTQNFVSYTSSSGELSFGDNIWNFSDRSGSISPNVFYQYGPNGTLYAPQLYLAVGPTFTVHYPFALTFYLNSTVLDDRQALFFNYSIVSATLRVAGSFDYVIFNSAASASAAPAEFQVNGFAYDPIGLVNDIELVVVGNDDGDTTTFFGMEANLTIDYWNASASAYSPVPSAFDVGADTGETSNGVAVYYLEPPTGAEAIAHMATGPSFLYGLWNVSNDPGYRSVADRLRPNNAFLFVNPGTTFVPSDAQWVPTITTGVASHFVLPNGGPYYLETMLTDYAPVGAALSLPANATTAFTDVLTSDTVLGVYTPMIIWGNPGFSSLALSGTGALGSPFQLPNQQSAPLAPVFAQWNDFQFPVFPGLLLVNTTAWVTVTPPSFAVSIPPWVQSPPIDYGMPNSTDLELQFWGVSNVSLVNAPLLSGWLSVDLSPYPEGAALFWNSSGNLIAGNSFFDEGTGLALYGGSNNTVWGNWFYDTPVASGDPGAFMNPGAATVGIFESESGDLVYNNYFDVPVPATTPTYDPLLCQIECEPSSYLDSWNVTPAPASAWSSVLGWNLTGSIIGTSYQAGNFWSNYGTQADPFGVLPYNDSGQISNGGDFDPLVYSTVSPIKFAETGLSSGVTWNVTVLGVTTFSNSSTLVVWLPNGTFPIEVASGADDYVVAPANVTAPAAVGSYVSVTFLPLGAAVFLEEGLWTGWSWSVTLALHPPFVGNVTFYSTAGYSLFAGALPDGNYTFTARAEGYAAAPANGTVTVGPGGPTVFPEMIDFSLVTGLSFTEQGLPSGTAWTVSLTQDATITNVSSFSSSIGFTVLNAVDGAYSYQIEAAGYNATPSSGSGTYPSNGTVSITFSPVAGVLEGTVVPTNASVYVDGAALASKSGYFTTSLLPGVHEVEALAAGYAPYYNNVTVLSGQVTSVALKLVALPSPTTSSSAGGTGNVAWGVAAALGVLALLFLALALYYRGRSRAPPPPLAPAPPVTPAASETAAVEPWREDGSTPGDAEGSAPPSGVQ